MPLLTVTKTYADLQVLNESDLDNIKNSIETFINVTKLDSSNIQNLAITSDLIAAGAVTETKIATDAVTTIKIKDLNVTEDKLATDSVTTTKIKDANVTLAKLAADSVDSSKIVDGTIVAADLATDAVETAKIKDANVTLAKLAPNSVDSSKIIDGSIVAADLAVGVIGITTTEPVSLRLIRGTITVSGTSVITGAGIVAGSGYSISTSGGDLIITFTSAFTDNPATTIEFADNGADSHLSVETNTASGERLTILRIRVVNSLGIGYASDVTFMAIGK